MPIGGGHLPFTALTFWCTLQVPCSRAGWGSGVCTPQQPRGGHQIGSGGVRTTSAYRHLHCRITNLTQSLAHQGKRPPCVRLGPFPISQFPGPPLGVSRTLKIKREAWCLFCASGLRCVWHVLLVLRLGRATLSVQFVWLWILGLIILVSDPKAPNSGDTDKGHAGEAESGDLIKRDEPMHRLTPTLAFPWVCPTRLPTSCLQHQRQTKLNILLCKPLLLDFQDGQGTRPPSSLSRRTPEGHMGSASLEKQRVTLRTINGAERQDGNRWGLGR